MIHGLQRFFAALAEAGIRTSPAERIDAVRALDAVGVEDATRFRQALQATLVKRDGQRAAFDEIFGRFFAGPGRASGRRRRGRARGRENHIGRRDCRCTWRHCRCRAYGRISSRQRNTENAGSLGE